MYFCIVRVDYAASFKAGLTIEIVLHVFCWPVNEPD